MNVEHRGATLRDVAQAAQVSEGTVSVVINGTRSGTRVSEATRQRILEAAESLGYRPNALARSLRRQRTGLVGLYAACDPIAASRPFLAELIGGIQEGCLELGLDLVLHTTPAEGRASVDALVDRRVDGLILFAPPTNRIAEDVRRYAVPAIAIGEPTEAVPVIGVDNEAGGVMLAEHLLSLGHRDVLYRDWCLPAVTARERRDAFCRTFESHGGKVVMGQRMTEDEVYDLSDDELRRLNAGTTAIACWEDRAAFGTCEVLAQAGLPDVSVTGFNGFFFGHEPKWDLTTVVAPWREVGLQALHSLHDVILGRSVRPRVELPVRLRPGRTTVPVPTQ